MTPDGNFPTVRCPILKTNQYELAIQLVDEKGRPDSCHGSDADRQEQP